MSYLPLDLVWSSSNTTSIWMVSDHNIVLFRIPWRGANKLNTSKIIQIPKKSQKFLKSPQKIPKILRVLFWLIFPSHGPVRDQDGISIIWSQFMYFGLGNDSFYYHELGPSNGGSLYQPFLDPTLYDFPQFKLPRIFRHLPNFSDAP